MTRLLDRVSSQWLLLLFSAASVCILAGALISQYVFLLHPCELCLYQRYPYVLVIGLGLIGGCFIKSKTLRFLAIFLCIIALLTDAGIAFYHAGVEKGIFKGPDACSSGDGGEQTLEEMRKAIMEAPLVSCNQAMVHFAGLSMAAWNGIIATFMAFGSLWILWRNHRRGLL